MGHLIDLIDDYRDRHGQPSEASIGRAIGVSEKTVNAWRRRGVRQLPERETLVRLAAFLGLSYEDDILPAVLRDVGYLEESGGDEAAPMTGA